MERPSLHAAQLQEGCTSAYQVAAAVSHRNPPPDVTKPPVISDRCASSPTGGMAARMANHLAKPLVPFNHPPFLQPSPRTTAKPLPAAPDGFRNRSGLRVCLSSPDRKGARRDDCLACVDSVDWNPIMRRGVLATRRFPSFSDRPIGMPVRKKSGVARWLRDALSCDAPPGGFTKNILSRVEQGSKLGAPLPGSRARGRRGWTWLAC